MQTFLPYPDFEKSAAVLDSKRLGSQCMEINTLLGALHETNNGGYRNHVVTRMWAGHELALCGFGFACHDEWERRYKRRADLSKLEEHMELASSGDLENIEKPEWFGRLEVHTAYQRLLLFKNYAHYSQHFPGIPAFLSKDDFTYPSIDEEIDMLYAIKKLLYPTTRWARKQRLAKPGRYYGDGGTIHSTTSVDVEVYEGKVVAVWFRCQPLAFKAVDVDECRARDMENMEASELSGVEVLDRNPAPRLGLG